MKKIVSLIVFLCMVIVVGGNTFAGDNKLVVAQRVVAALNENGTVTSKYNVSFTAGKVVIEQKAGTESKVELKVAIEEGAISAATDAERVESIKLSLSGLKWNTDKAITLSDVNTSIKNLILFIVKI